MEKDKIKAAVAYGIGWICGKHNLVILESKLEEVCEKYAESQVKNLNEETETKPHRCGCLCLHGEHLQSCPNYTE